MKVEYRSSFLRDIKKIRSKQVKQMIKDVIENCEKAQTIAEIKKCERLVSKGGYYKIKIPPYRFGIYIYAGTIEFIKFGTRENFYKDFPPH